MNIHDVVRAKGFFNRLGDRFRAAVGRRLAMGIRALAVSLLVVGLTNWSLLAQEAPSGQRSVNRIVRAQPIPPALTEYMGREIAPTMSYHGADWLTRDERQDEEDCVQMFRQLRLQPGMTVCDMGCGNGFYTLQMADAVGADGLVLAVDIQSKMLRKMEARAGERNLTNIRSLLGTVVDPKLPRDGTVDLVLCVDVYHEFSHPEQMLQAVRRSLRPDGVVVLVEYREEDPNVPILPLHKMSKAQVNKELTSNGFRLVREFDGLPWQHMMFFSPAP